MWRSLLLKEWLKLRWCFMAALVSNLGVCIKILLNIRYHMRIEHAEMVWYQAIYMHTVFYQPLCYLPLLTGLALAAAPFPCRGVRRSGQRRFAGHGYGWFTDQWHWLALLLLPALLGAFEACRRFQFGGIFSLLMGIDTGTPSRTGSE